MTRDKQLLHVNLTEVLEKRRLDQALSAKEFAVVAGISCFAARAWFRQPDFPAFAGVVFWQDFVQWRSAKTGLQNVCELDTRSAARQESDLVKPSLMFSGKAAQILAEA